MELYEETIETIITIDDLINSYKSDIIKLEGLLGPNPATELCESYKARVKNLTKVQSELYEYVKK